MTESLRDLIRERGVKYRDLLPTKIVERIGKHIDEQWKDQEFSFAELYDSEPQAAHREILGALGHGVSASDDSDVEAWLEELGVDPHPTRHLNIDNDYNAAEKLISRLFKDSEYSSPE